MSALEEVRAYAAARGGSVEIFRFDCGETLTLTLPGRGPRRFSAECGDLASAAEQALAVINTTIAEATRILAAITAEDVVASPEGGSRD